MKRSVIIIPILFFAFFGLAQNAQAATYYVATNGNDDNPGTLSQPFKTIQKAANIVNPGDKVIVRAGVYYERVVIKTSGTTSQPIVFEGERGPGGEWLTIVDGGETWTGFVPAPEVGAGVYKKTDSPFAPHTSVWKNRKVNVITSEYMNSGSGFSYLQNGPRVSSYPGDPWDGIEAMVGYLNGITYVRFRYNRDPGSDMKFSRSDRAAFHINNKSYIIIKDFHARNTYTATKVDGSDSHHNIIERNYLTGHYTGVAVSNGAYSNHIRNNEITPNHMYGGDFYGWGSEDSLMHHCWLWFRVRTYGFDRGVTISGAGANNEIYENHIYQGYGGINSRAGPSDSTKATLAGRENINNINANSNLKVYKNTLHNFFADAFLVGGSEVSGEWYDNVVYNALYGFRIQDITKGPLYIYRNLFYDTIGPGGVIFFYFVPDSQITPENYPHAEIYIYQNSFSPGNYSFFLSEYGKDFGLQKTCFLNNILSGLRFYRADFWIWDNSGKIGLFDYNWVGGDYYHKSGRKTIPDWFGPYNINADGQRIWNPADPSFLPMTGRKLEASCSIY